MINNDNQIKRAEIFRDTRQLYTENPLLKKAVEKSRRATRIIPADEYPALNRKPDKSGTVTVSKARTFEAAVKLHGLFPEKKIAVLNFASATNPGGGVVNGSSAQEESLCRCSTLYPTLSQKRMWDGYYLKNRETGSAVHTDDIIYSPDIVICKSDEAFPKRIDESEFVSVDVITCAAPNLREKTANQFNTENGGRVFLSPTELMDIHVKRGRHICHVAAANDVDIIILGAFGCGAFRNDPNVVADAYAAVLKEYAKYFDRVEFAIYCGEPGRPDNRNYDAFKKLETR